MASILFIAERLMEEREFEIDYSRGNFDRKPLPVKFEKQIQIIWEKRKEQNPKLWNGTKFRLAQIRIK